MVTRSPVMVFVPFALVSAALLAGGCRAILGIGAPEILGGDGSPDAEVHPDVVRDAKAYDASHDTGHAEQDAGKDAGHDAGHDARRTDSAPLGDAGAPDADGSDLLVGLLSIPIGASPDNDQTGQSEAYQKQAVQSGTVQTMGVLLLDTTLASVVYLGLYDSTNNDAGQTVPNNLIATLRILPGGAWRTGWYSGPPTTGSPVTITSTNTYWFALLTPAGAEGVDGGQVDYYDFSSNAGAPSAGADSYVLTALPASSSGWHLAQTASPMVAYAAK